MGTISGGPVYRSFTPGTIQNQRGLFDHKSRAESRTDLYPPSAPHGDALVVDRVVKLQKPTNQPTVSVIYVFLIILLMQHIELSEVETNYMQISC